MHLIKYLKTLINKWRRVVQKRTIRRFCRLLPSRSWKRKIHKIRPRTWKSSFEIKIPFQNRESHTKTANGVEKIFFPKHTPYVHKKVCKISWTKTRRFSVDFWHLVCAEKRSRNQLLKWTPLFFVFYIFYQVGRLTLQEWANCV